MNRRVRPDACPVAAAVSRARATVVPTATTRVARPIGLAGVHGLVTIGVVQRGGDVRRQRHVAGGSDGGQGVGGTQLHGERVAGLRPAPHHQDGSAFVVDELFAPCQPPRRAHEALPAAVVGIERFQEQDLDRATAVAVEAQPGGDHAGVVHDHEITRLEQLRQVAHVAMVRRRASATVHEQAGRIPRLDRVLGDGGRREVVVEVGQPHAGQGTAQAGRAGGRVPAPRDDAIMSTYRTDQVAVDGGTFDLHVWVPDSGGGPGLLLLQEIFGVGPYIRAVAERLTGLGYVVGAPDIFWRIERNWESDHSPEGLEASLGMVQKFDFPQGVADCVAALHRIKELPEVSGGVGVIGFCLGGTLGYLTAAVGSPACCVSYYGSGVAGMLDQLENIECPVLFHFGGSDSYIPAEQVDAVRAACEGRDHVMFNVEAEAGPVSYTHLRAHET